MSIYILCAAVLVAAFPVAWLLKREGERSWARHQAMVRAAKRREQFANIGRAMIQVRITVLDQMTPALQKAGREMQRLIDALEGSQP